MLKGTTEVYLCHAKDGGDAYWDRKYVVDAIK